MTPLSKTSQIVSGVLVFAWALIAQADPARSPRVDTTGQQPENRALYVTVQKGDKLIGGLKKGNFRLYVEGEPVNFQLQEPEKPASVALLVEYSRASWMYIRDIISAMQGFVQSAPEGNWYALATFAHELNIAQDFTKQRGKVSQAFSTLTTPNWDEVDTYDALHKMLSRMDRMEGRKVLIFVGSGFDTFSSHTLEDVIHKAEAADVTVFALGAGSLLRGQYEAYLGSTQRLEVMQAQNFLNSLAEKTGGWAQFPRFEQAFPDVMKGVMQMLQFQYKLVYTPPTPLPRGEFRKIEVQAFTLEDDERTDFKVFVREGWRY